MQAESLVVIVVAAEKHVFVVLRAVEKQLFV